MATIHRSANEISDMEGNASEWVVLGDTDVPGMTYEEGVSSALLWVLGQTEESPIEVPAPPSEST